MRTCAFAFRSSRAAGRRIFFLSLLFMALAMGPRLPARAASPAVITSCRLISAKKIKITASVSDLLAVSGNKCYLFALTSSGFAPEDQPLRSAAWAEKLTFTIPLANRLYTRFVLAQKSEDGSFMPASSARYIENPGKTARYRYRFPAAASKKGLQVNASMLEDAQELNVHHSALNIVFSEMIASAGEQNRSQSIACRYQGKTYWFRKSVIESFDRQLAALKKTGTTVSAILLLGWRDDLLHLIYPSGRSPGHGFYAWNTEEPSARKQLQASISFLASRYSSKSSKNGQIVNWIVGNEVNNYLVYHYAGDKTLEQYAQIYADAFRLTFNAVSSVYANARVYISLDHLWNTATVKGTWPSRQMLDAFAAALDAQGHIPWNLAYHPYSSPLTEPKFWENKNGQLTGDLTSPVINMGNISLLTSYIRQTYGENTRIILSEQGYTSVQGKKNVEKEQSAAIAYSYYLTEADDMIDSFIMNRHVDHRTETAQGLNLGLWTTRRNAVESARRRKDSWNVFKYMDTTRSEQVTAALLPVIGADSWAGLISGFGPDLYAKTSVSLAKLRKVSSFRKRAAVPRSWRGYGAACGLAKINGNLCVRRDLSRNDNVVWGFSQNLGKGIRFTSDPVFYTTLKITGADKPNVTVKLRFFSGNNILESEGAVRAGRPVSLGVSLGGWKYKNRVTQIQILAAPVNGGTWKQDARFELTFPVRGR